MPMTQPENDNSTRGHLSRGAWSRHLQISALCVLLLASVYLFELYQATIPARYFIPLHLTLEMSSIIVCFAVFLVGWFGYRQTGSARELIIGVTFGTAGALDIIHTLNYEGMPDFLGVNTPGKAAAYWILARLVVGLGLVWACLTSAEKRYRRPYAQLLSGIAAAVVIGSVCIVNANSGLVGKALLPGPGRPPSDLKVRAEYLIIATYAMAFLLLSERQGWGVREVRGLRSALILAAFAEVAFTLYLSPFAYVNALGHVFKTAAYILILNALFFSAIRKPYDQLSNARDELEALYIDAQEHRKEMERSFARIGTALSSSLDTEEALGVIADLAEEMLHVDCSVVVFLDESGTAARVASQRGVCHKLDRPVDVTIQLGKLVSERKATLLENDIESTGWVDCTFDDPKCLRSVICAPMVYEDRVLGVIAIYSYRKTAFEDGDARLLEGFATHAAVAVHNALTFQHEARIADVLQRSFMSQSTVTTDRFEIAQVYEPAMNEALVGGDFYDVFDAPDGRIVIAIGDVSGKGLKAAVHTTMVRYGLRAYVEEGHSIGEVTRLLNAAICRFTESDTFVTMFAGYLDPRTGDLAYCNAGHEPPLYAHKNTYLTLPITGAALGIVSGALYDEGAVKLEPGSVLLLYTDGISEARHGHSFLGIDGVGQQLNTCHGMSGADVARCVHRAAVEFAGGELRDDAAILAVRALS